MRHALIRQNSALLRQGIALLDELAPELYAKPDPCSGAAIGEHLRHVLDFYLCFLRDADSGRIDYDDRPRDPRIPVDPVHARSVVQEILQELPGVESADGEVLVKADAPKGSGPHASSSLERELQFLASHTVHHYAIIALSLRQADHAVPEGFGVAPSTLRFWGENRSRTG